jgi:hypothetical protein
MKLFRPLLYPRPFILVKIDHPRPFILVLTGVARVLVAKARYYRDKLNHLYSIYPACHRPFSAIRSSG